MIDYPWGQPPLGEFPAPSLNYDEEETMLRLRPFLFGAAGIAASIVLLGALHHRMATGREAPLSGLREQLSVGFLPVT